MGVALHGGHEIGDEIRAALILVQHLGPFGFDVLVLARGIIDAATGKAHEHDKKCAGAGKRTENRLRHGQMVSFEPMLRKIVSRPALSYTLRSVHDHTSDGAPGPMNGAESLVSTLVGCGVDVCFTNPGTSEM